MKKIIVWGLAVLVAVAAIAAWSYRDVLVMMSALGPLKPDHAFTDQPAPSAPDYASTESWAALPDRADGADVVPGPSVTDAQANAAADVFFVHPTTYYNPEHWNQPLGDVVADKFTDVFVMRNQASAFNGCCRVFAPRYRQATIYSFIDEGPDGEAALSLAYEDVERAFEYFLTHFSAGRPFILAGHSQGTVHVNTLLQRRIAGTALVERLVAAYAIGFPVNEAEHLAKAPDIPVCANATQTGCVVNWNAVGPRARMVQDSRGNICVNPLTWKTDGRRADFAENPGGVAFNRDYGLEVDSLREDDSFVPRIEPGVADAQCVEGRLLISQIHSDNFRGRPTGRDSYHIYDLSLFYMSLRENAVDRVKAFLQSHPAMEVSP